MMSKEFDRYYRLQALSERSFERLSPTKTYVEVPILDWAARQALSSSRASRLEMSRWGAGAARGIQWP
jgi:hypothetical protein